MDLFYEIRQHLIGQRLGVGGYFVGVYPISYFRWECLEIFCERIGWELDQYTYSDYTLGSGGSGMMTVERNPPKYESYGETLQATEYRFLHG